MGDRCPTVLVFVPPLPACEHEPCVEVVSSRVVRVRMNRVFDLSGMLCFIPPRVWTAIRALHGCIVRPGVVFGAAWHDVLCARVMLARVPMAIVMPRKGALARLIKQTQGIIVFKQH